MMQGGNGPQLGVYSFDFSTSSWPSSGIRLWLNDVCVGTTSGNCPSDGAPTPAPTPPPTLPTPAPTPAPPAGCVDANQNCEVWAASGECEANPGYMLENC